MSYSLSETCRQSSLVYTFVPANHIQTCPPDALSLSIGIRRDKRVIDRPGNAAAISEVI